MKSTNMGVRDECMDGLWMACCSFDHFSVAVLISDFKRSFYEGNSCSVPVDRSSQTYGRCSEAIPFVIVVLVVVLVQLIVPHPMVEFVIVEQFFLAKQFQYRL